MKLKKTNVAKLVVQFSQRVRQNLYFLIHVVHESFHLLFTVYNIDTLRISIVSHSKLSRYALGKFSKMKKKKKKHSSY